MSLCKVQVWNYAWYLRQTCTFPILLPHPAGNSVNVRAVLLSIFLYRFCMAHRSISIQAPQSPIRMLWVLIPSSNIPASNQDIQLHWTYSCYWYHANQANNYKQKQKFKSLPCVSANLQKMNTYILSKHSIAAIRHVKMVFSCFHFCTVLSCDKYWCHCK